MGFLTTITFRNDAYGSFKDNPEQVVEGILEAMSVGGVDRGYFSVGSHANPVVCQKPRHASDSTCFVHMGNTVVNVDRFSDNFIALMQRNPDFADNLISHMENEVKALRKIQKEQKVNS